MSQKIIDVAKIDDPTLSGMFNNIPAMGACCPEFRERMITIKGDHNFTTAHRLAGGATQPADEFLLTARRCAEYYLRRTPAPYVPWWDYDLPEKAPHLWDSSAAAVAASGLLDLSELVSNPADRDRYRAAALAILRTLCSDNFLPRKRPKWEGILMNAVYHFHKNLGVDESVAWGDHFFVEALVKAVAGKSAAAW